MSANPELITGVIEGFYGVFYTFPERVDLIRFLGRSGFNTYIYGPKNDRQHRARWWQPYPETVMDEFAGVVQAARESGVTFCYAISPGESFEYRSPVDFARLTGKLYSFYQIGVRAFSLFLDDNKPGFRHNADGKLYGTLAQAQAQLANQLFRWLRELDPACTLSLCPPEYSGRAPFAPALIELAGLLHKEIDLFYTGPEICSPEITAADARSFAQATGRKPLIWDNYPVNDLAMQPELHLAPLSGRAPDLLAEIKGYLANPMIQAEASKIPLLTASRYLAGPGTYRPDAAWNAALRQVAGKDYAAALRLLAENTCVSCLGRGGQTLDALAGAALADLRDGMRHSRAILALEDYLTAIDEAAYLLKFRMENLSLRNNLLPWIEALEHWLWMARFCLIVLRNIAQGLPYTDELNRIYELRMAVETHPKRIASQALLPLIDLTLKEAGREQREKVFPRRFSLLHKVADLAKQKNGQSFMPFPFWRQK